VSDLSAAVTDLAAAATLIGCAVSVRESRNFWWPISFGVAATGAVVGAIHHLAFPADAGNISASAHSFALAGVLLGFALAAMLSAAVFETRPVHPRALVTLGWCTAGLFVLLAAAGRGNVGPLVISQLPTMVAIVALWTAATLRERPPGAAAVLGAMGIIALSATAFVPPVRTAGGVIGIEPVTWQHLLELPGMVLLAKAARNVGTQRGFRYERSRLRKAHDGSATASQEAQARRLS
jgi:hypothetical protein